jgi:hypothetical protein
MIPSAKVTIYKPAGNGRDSYISTNNGGFGVEHSSHYKPNYTKNNGLCYAKLGSQPHVTIYQRDGAGRDSYIYSNNGGFASYTYTNSTFFSTLRDG